MSELIRQMSMFDRPPLRIVETPAARNTDPYTSHAAADDITRSGKRAHQQHQAIAAVRAKPGLTSFELALATGLDRFMLARRLPECVTAGGVVKGTPKKCSVTGKMAISWWIPSNGPHAA